MQRAGLVAVGLAGLGMLVGACGAEVQPDDETTQRKDEPGAAVDAATLQVRLDVAEIAEQPPEGQLTVAIAWNNASGPTATLTQEVVVEGPFPKDLTLELEGPPPDAAFFLFPEGEGVSDKRIAVGYVVALKFEDKRTGEPLIPRDVEQAWTCSYGVGNDHVLIYLEDEIPSYLLDEADYPPLHLGYQLMRATRFGTPRPDTCLGPYMICADRCLVQRDLCEEVDTEDACQAVAGPCVDACLEQYDPASCPAEDGPLFVHNDDSLSPADLDDTIDVHLGGVKEYPVW